MKLYSLILFLGFAAVAVAQPNKKQLQAHKAKVAQSRSGKTTVVSLDTLFCSGVPVAIASSHAGKAAEPWCIVTFASRDTVIEISEAAQNVAQAAGTTDLSYFFYFPSLNMMCKVSGKENVFHNICKYGLINNQLLDSSKAETFVTLKGSLDPKTRAYTKTGAGERWQWNIPDRDKKSPLLFQQDTIWQDNAWIGTFEVGTVTGPKGNMEHFTIFNLTSAIVCSATLSDSTRKEWTLLTMRDKKYHSITIKGTHSLGEILEYLIKKEYL